jgi:Bifunctional DNA primase/polymerase, N-terminal
MSGRGDFNEFAERVVDNGFTVTPTKGKVPVVRRWQNPKPTDAQWVGKMVRANRYAGHNLGIVCGRVLGIDIDASEPIKAAQLEVLAAEYLGATRFQRVGRAPRTLLLYRPAAGEFIPSLAKLGGCIDVLSEGKQFVAFGIHPGTGKPYRWIAANPATAQLDDLPTVTAVALTRFADAVCRALGSPVRGVPEFSIRTMDTALKLRHRSRQGEHCAPEDARIVRGADGRVMDGREAFLAKLTAAEFAKRTHATPDELGNRVWARFIAEADLSRPKGSNPRQRWSLKDAESKARAICRRNPDLKRPRRSRGGHPASHLHAWRKPGFWTAAHRELHLAEVGRRITTPATLAVARVMIEAMDVSSGFCTAPIVEIAKRASCSPKSVKVARAMLRDAGLWIAGPSGVFVPLSGLNADQLVEKTKRKKTTGTTKVPPLYHLVVSDSPLPSLSSGPKVTSRPYQPDMFGAAVVDLAHYRRGLLPADIAAVVRTEMRARGVTQDKLAGEIGISQPQLANALSQRFGLSPIVAARLLDWLRSVAA